MSEPAKPMSDGLKSMTVKVRGDFGSGRTQLLAQVKCLAGSLGMQTRLDADGHNLTIVSTKAERDRLFALNERKTP